MTPAALTVTAASFSRAYGSANPGLTGTVVGMQNSDVITATYSTTANTLSPVGGYSIIPSLSDPGNKLGNYAVTSNNGTLTITSVPLTVQADNKTRGVGSVNPAFTGTLTGLKNGDNLSATYGCSATIVSPAGSYPIVPTLVDPNNRQNNYTVSLLNGTLTVTNVLTQRSVQVVDAAGSPGSLVNVAVELAAQGDENTAGFSLSFDPSILTYASNTLGSAMSPGSELIVNTAPASTGAIGVLVGLPTAVAFPVGTQQLAVFSFLVNPAITWNTNVAVNFVNQPAIGEVSSPNADVLPANFVGGTVTVFAGYEGDVTSGPNGDGRVTAADWTLIGRLVAGLNTVADAGQFMRADCAPRTTAGDGRISATDWTQAGRYVVGLDPIETCGGPAQAGGLYIARAPKISGGGGSRTDSGRVLKLIGTSAQAGATIQVPVELSALGDENTAAFSVTFDPAVLDVVSALPGSAMTPGAALVINTNRSAVGQLGVLLALPPGQAFAPGARQVLVLTLKVRESANQSRLDLGFADNPVLREVGSLDAQVLATAYVNGAINLGRPVGRLEIDVSRLADAGVRLSMQGSPGKSYQVLVSSNFVNWTVLTTVAATSTGQVDAVDAKAKDFQIRYYRVLAQ